MQQTKFSIQNGRQWDVFLLYISTATVNLMICLVATVMLLASCDMRHFLAVWFGISSLQVVMEACSAQ